MNLIKSTFRTNKFSLKIIYFNEHSKQNTKNNSEAKKVNGTKDQYNNWHWRGKDMYQTLKPI